MTRKPPSANGSSLSWIKSSYSSNEGPQCVEVAAASDGVHVRDSKNTEGPQLALTPTAWNDFIGYASGS